MGALKCWRYQVILHDEDKVMMFSETPIKLICNEDESMIEEVEMVLEDIKHYPILSYQELVKQLESKEVSITELMGITEEEYKEIFEDEGAE